MALAVKSPHFKKILTERRNYKYGSIIEVGSRYYNRQYITWQ
jgi:hypothetical protein